MNLGDQLRQFKDGVVSQLSPADVALMDKGTERLLRSGIVAHDGWQQRKNIGI